MVLNIVLLKRRNQDAAEALLHRLVEGQPAELRGSVTDKLAGYSPAIRKLLPQAEHRTHKGRNNRAENGHQPSRRRERTRRWFKSPDHTRRFLEPFGPIRRHFCPGRHLFPAATYRTIPAERFVHWDNLTGVAG